MNKIIAAAVVVSTWTSAVDLASAQPALKRLEELIRKERAAGPEHPAGTAPGTDTPEQGYLGIVADDRDDRGRGVRVLEVLPDGPADRAGLRAQDLITGVGGVPVRQMSDMAPALEQVPVGGSLTFEILRGQRRLEIDVTFAVRPPPEERRFKLLPPPPEEPLPPPPPEAPPPPLAVPPGLDETRIEMLERRIRELERRLQQLERKVAELAGTGQADTERPMIVPVTVTVTLNGAPVENARVAFVPATRGGLNAVGQTDATGRARLSTLERGDGAAPGRYLVTIDKLQAVAQGNAPVENADSAKPDGGDLLPKK
jgi:hypothetical protein